MREEQENNYLGAVKVILSLGEEKMSEVVSQLLANDGFVAAIQRTISNSLQAKSTLDASVSKVLGILNVPTLSDIERVRSKINELENAMAQVADRLEELDPKIDALVDKANGVVVGADVDEMHVDALGIDVSRADDTSAETENNADTNTDTNDSIEAIEENAPVGYADFGTVDGMNPDENQSLHPHDFDQVAAAPAVVDTSASADVAADTPADAAPASENKTSGDKKSKRRK